MIVYGYRYKSIMGKELHSFCHKCSYEKRLAYSIIGYTHIFWIPFFVFSKKVGIVCPNCKARHEHKEIEEDLRSDLKRDLKLGPKVLLYNLLLVVSLLMGIYSLTLS